MFQIRVSAGFSAAHFLRDYHGKCENLHGHNYAVHAHVQGAEIGAGGMLMDFSELKGALRAVCARLDHKNLNDFAEFAQNPSAERIARFIYDGILEQLPALGNGGGAGAARLHAVDVFETETSRARYIADS